MSLSIPRNFKTLLVLTIFSIFSLSTLLLVGSQDTTGFFYCDAQFCEELLRLTPCPEKRNCTTIGFRTFLDPSECNCCDYCFDYLKENATCSPNSPQKPTEMCGPFLECKLAQLETDPATCQTIETGPKDQQAPDPEFCMTKRKEYMDADEKGTLGMVQFLPECDAGGYYAPRQCIPGSVCYCSNSEGERIFGLALPGDKQDCACARDVARLQSFGFRGRMPHCLPNGDYDELQCAVRDCYCRSYPTTVYQPQNMTRLPCYDSSIHVYKPDVPLYYMRTCELLRAEAEIDIAEAALKGAHMIISDVPNCDPDGNYAPVQTNFDKQFCADAYTGEMLESFFVDKISRKAQAMNCYCARARNLMKDSANGKPQCCENGNFQALQHIGTKWFCVDSYGRQDVSVPPIEVHESLKDTLPCYSADPDVKVGCVF